MINRLKQLQPTLPAIAAITFGVALILRLIFLWQWNQTTYGQLPLLDALAYDKWAEDILNGHWLRERAFYQSPLYPYLLALLYGIFGHSLLVGSIFNVLLGALTCAGLSVIAGRYFGTGGAIATGLLAAFYRPFIFYSAPLLKESLGLCLLTFFVLFALNAVKKNNSRDYILSGVMLGLTALVRSNILLLAPAFVLLMLFYWQRASLKPLLMFGLATFLMILPATIHNATVSHDFVLISYGGGLNFYLGHSPVATGSNSYLPNISSDPLEGEESDVRQMAEAALGHPLRPSEVSDFWFHQGMQYISRNPGNIFVLLTNKFWLFWDNYEHGDNYDVPFVTKNFDTILSWPLINFWLVSLLTAISIGVFWRTPQREVKTLVCFAGVYMISVVMFYVTDRYRLPVVVFLLPLAGGAVVGVQQSIRRRSWTNLTAASALAVLSLWLSFTLVGDAPTRDATNWGIIAGLQSDLQQDQQAVDTLQKGLAFSWMVGSSSYIKTSLSAERLGRLEDARQLLEIATRYYPQDGRVFYHYGRFWSLIGNLSAAQSALEHSIELSPGYVLSYTGLAKVYNKRGNHAKAHEIAQRGLTIAPNDSELMRLIKSP